MGKIVPCWNNRELLYVNQMAMEVGCDLPFPTAKTLTKDTGERFFSEYIKSVKPMMQTYNGDECCCSSCRKCTTNDAEPAKTICLVNPMAGVTLTTITATVNRTTTGTSDTPTTQQHCEYPTNAATNTTHVPVMATHCANAHTILLRANSTIHVLSQVHTVVNIKKRMAPS
mgnify:CR=1 FL=1